MDQFDIIEFYPSITENLHIPAYEFAQDCSNISDADKWIILQAIQSILYKSDTPWIQKGDQHFDVSMGSLDSADTCSIWGCVEWWIRGLHIDPNASWQN